MNANTYQLEKSIWTDADFDQMSWHDCPVHAIAFGDEGELLLDIDYMFRWVLPKKNSRYYKFWIAPCTLVFENVYDIEFDTNHTSIIIDHVSRENPRRPRDAEHINRDFEYDWIIDTTVGGFSFKSVGFKQHVRQQPVFIGQQRLKPIERGGISFSLDTI